MSTARPPAALRSPAPFIKVPNCRPPVRPRSRAAFRRHHLSQRRQTHPASPARQLLWGAPRLAIEHAAHHAVAHIFFRKLQPRCSQGSSGSAGQRGEIGIGPLRSVPIPPAPTPLGHSPRRTTRPFRAPVPPGTIHSSRHSKPAEIACPARSQKPIRKDRQPPRQCGRQVHLQKIRDPAARLKMPGVRTVHCVVPLEMVASTQYLPLRHGLDRSFPALLRLILHSPAHQNGMHRLVQSRRRRAGLRPHARF